MSHDHDHSSGKNLKLAFFLNISFTVIEIVGGLLVNSVAILSDAIHDLGDSFSLGLAWYLDKKSKQQADQKYSFGYARFSLLGALINSLVLVLGAVIVLREAIDRLVHPEAPNVDGMLLFALLGVAINGFAAWKMKSGKSLNEQVVSWHLLEDVLGWTAILIGAIILKFKYIWWLDPALSITIMLYISYGVIKRLRETLHLFLQGVPRGVDLNAIEKDIQTINGISSMHHTHIWSLEGEHHVFSSHLKLENGLTIDQVVYIKRQVKDALKTYGFKHYTVETELNGEVCDFDV
ncbi:cation diffusion facilitator family transporter [Parvicella tangerina]|uniref:Cadmium, cobalt and zinc/H(+)-K(+) antiporter n=1 Tax=Parvicella tangerina TaxID=2829795 RepID=A0A916NBD2_9FLAO|nr:cation diffusion facilitator family transporter [Parvicella tangerina]CAG5080668.1 Cadmium, cobalt and zinc/H(+)-K(+) antiporter [Parvicella tangerina]